MHLSTKKRINSGQQKVKKEKKEKTYIISISISTLSQYDV